MATRPTTTPDEFSTAVGSREPPSSGLNTSGFPGGIPVPSKTHNYFFGWFSAWIRYLATLSPASFVLACDDVQPQPSGTGIDIRNDSGVNKLRVITNTSGSTVGAYAYPPGVPAPYSVDISGLTGGWMHLIEVSGGGAPADSTPVAYRNSTSGDGVKASYPGNSNVHTWRHDLPLSNVTGECVYTITAVSAECYKSHADVTMSVNLITLSRTGTQTRTTLIAAGTISTVGSWAVALSGALSITLPDDESVGIEVSIENTHASAQEAGWGAIRVQMTKTCVE